MPELQGPYEILELGDQGSLKFKPLNWTEGDVTIHPRFQSEPKTIRAIRVWVGEDVKPLFPDYYDITAQTLVAQLRPILQREDYRDLIITITKHGVPPKARYQVKVTKSA
jgi:hypothetical protein